jgi:fibronectin-binding autotransporter adhesin
VSAGTLESGVDGALSDASDFTVGNGATLSIATGNQEIGSLSGAGTVTIASGASLTTGLNERVTTFSGSFTGNGDLTIDGSATGMTLTGNSVIGGDLTVCCALLDVRGTFRTTGTAAVLGGNLTVSGATGMLIADTVAMQGGNISVTGGGKINTNLLGSIGGDIDVTGAGSLVTADVTDLMAIVGDARLNISSGGRVETTGDAVLSTVAFGNASATVQGEGSEWRVGGALIIGDTISGFATPGLLTVSDRGRVSAGTLIIGEEGAVQVGTGGRSGIIVTTSLVNNGTLAFNHTDALTFSASISGSGAITKAGGGRLELTGVSTLTGPTDVQAGQLAVNGSLGASVVTVGKSATLSGTGTVGGIIAQSGSTLAPGNSIGILSVAGHIGFAAGSSYALEINAAGQSDRIAATGQATLSGGTVRVLPDQGTGYVADSPYTILTARGGVSGVFSGTAGGEFAFITPTLGYSNDAVTLTLVRKVVPPHPPSPPTPVAFNSVAVTKNQYETANGVEAIGAGNALFDTVLGLSVSGARQAFTALSGEAHASAATVAYGDGRLVRETILNRLREPKSANPPAFLQGPYRSAYAADPPGGAPRSVVVAPAIDQPRFALWGEGFGSWGRVRSDGNAASLDSSTGGFIIGAEVLLDPAFRMGLAGGFTRTSFDVNGRLSSGSNESVFGALYGAGSWGAINVRFGASHAWHDIDISRTILFPGFGDATFASYDGSTDQAFAEVGYRFDLGRASIEPFVGASVLRLHTDGFQENGGVAALRAYGRDNDLATTTVGVRGEVQISQDTPLILKGLLGWRHAYGDVEPDALLAFAEGASAFSVSGVPVDRDALVAEAGLAWQATDAIRLGVSYSGQIGSRAQDHALKGDFTWRFENR